MNSSPLLKTNGVSIVENGGMMYQMEDEFCHDNSVFRTSIVLLSI